MTLTVLFDTGLDYGNPPQRIFRPSDTDRSFRITTVDERAMQRWLPVLGYGLVSGTVVKFHAERGAETFILDVWLETHTKRAIIVSETGIYFE